MKNSEKREFLLTIENLNASDSWELLESAEEMWNGGTLDEKEIEISIKMLEKHNPDAALFWFVVNLCRQRADSEMWLLVALKAAMKSEKFHHPHRIARFQNELPEHLPEDFCRDFLSTIKYWKKDVGESIWHVASILSLRDKCLQCLNNNLRSRTEKEPPVNSHL